MANLADISRGRDGVDSENGQPVLVVDLDGTLIRTDLLVESGLKLLTSRPVELLGSIKALVAGKASLKAYISGLVDIDVEVLPYRTAVMELICRHRDRGGIVVLATASDQRYANAIALHTGLFDQVLASDGQTNLSAERKRDQLVERYGERGFDYVGNSYDDVAVWSACRQGIVVNPSNGVERAARKVCEVSSVVRDQEPAMRVWVRALRIHQWLKNLLIFVPLLVSHHYGNLVLVWQSLIGFLMFSLCASSVYLLNDLLDRENDRGHPSKHRRPLASGALPLLAGVVAAPILLGCALAGSFWLAPYEFSILLVVYYFVTLLYSLFLKRIMMVDVATLAGLYTIRIVAGGAATGIEVSFWMLAFSMFLFLSLALVKRYTELYDARQKGLTEKSRGRGFYPVDLEMIASLGGCSGYIAVLVMAFYIQDATTAILYSHPKLIWLSCPLLLYWVGRIWLIAHRGQMHDDPLVFAAKDKASWLVAAGVMASFYFAR